MPSSKKYRKIFREIAQKLSKSDNKTIFDFKGKIMKPFNEEGTVAGDGNIPTDKDTVQTKKKKDTKVDSNKPIFGEKGIIYMYADWVPAEIVKDTYKAKELNLHITPNERKGISKIVGTKDNIIKFLEYCELCGGEMMEPCVKVYPKLEEESFFQKANNTLNERISGKYKNKITLLDY